MDSSASQAPNDELVTIGSYEFVAPAELAQNYLRSHGIEAFLANANIVNANWLLGNALGYVKLQVPSGQAEMAKDLLDTAEFDPNDEDAEQSEAESSDDEQEYVSEVRPMESLRNFRKPILLLFLGPILLMFGLGLLSILFGFLRQLAKSLGLVD